MSNGIRARASSAPRLAGVLAAVVTVATAVTPAAAQSQPVKPNILLLFDTSGSMLWPVCYASYAAINGDNSAQCPGFDIPCSGTGSCNGLGCGDGYANDTRLYKVKRGAFNVVSAFGEVNFAMARFRNVKATFTCDAANNSRAGGWAGQACDTAVGTGGNQADVLVPFAANNTNEILSWMNNCSDYPSPGTCNAPPDTANCSLCPDCGTGCDKELRGVSATPIAGALYDIRANYLAAANGVIANDTKSACRPYKVILLTDGLQSSFCTGDPVAQARALFQNAGKSIPVHVIGFGDAALKPNLDAIAAAGGTGQAVIVDNEVSLALALANIISESLLSEKCNNADDDCNGQCDENFPRVGVNGAGCSNPRAAQTCTAGRGVCQRTGEYVCKADGTGSECNATPGAPTCPGDPSCNASGEVCGNGLDDDCDGQIDEGCVPCVAQPEICDGKDNNCNGQVDEGYVSVPCGSDIGTCTKGNTVCVAGRVVCNGATGPSTETCDNRDNNCDSVVDLFSRACYPAASGCNTSSGICQGVCRIGLQTCTAGVWGSCVGFVGPTTEICNGLDDDCDGQVDEGVSFTCTNYATCTTYQSCSPCPSAPAEVCDGKDNDCNGQVDDNALQVGQPCGTQIGECTKGAFVCSNGQLSCRGGKPPSNEVCDGKDNNCNGTIDDGVPGVGQACGSAVGTCRQGTRQCVAGKLTCLGAVPPAAEVCDNQDNDCNGAVDDNVPSSVCGSSVGECRQGTTVCSQGQTLCQGAIGPQQEVCDGKDNDCNGLVDDNPSDVGAACGSAVGECKPGVTQCVNGAKVCVGAVGPKPEVCDGKDNDCNGQIDDGLAGIGQSCGTDVGECTKGTTACVQLPGGGGYGLVCQGSVGPKQEVCDGKDNNCDGNVDETFPQSGQTCSNNVGACKGGFYACEAGKLVCKGGTVATPEVCDGVDNDCNGAIDDNVPGDGAPCTSWPGGSTLGQCKAGVQRCVGGKFVCVGEVPPAKEICDGKDNDCDGQADNLAECPGSSACVEGRCLVPCASGEFVCPGGTRCKDGYCVPDKCAAVQCKNTERCVDGTCIAKCDGVSCDTHEKCEASSGRCVDDSCLTKGCKSGEVCINYQCVATPCPPGKCAKSEQCWDGKCYEPCYKQCPRGQACVRGQCTSALCEGFPCPDNFRCVVKNGTASCEADPCRAVKCPPGQVCRDGGCKDDPCATTTCPAGTRCKLAYDGTPTCNSDASGSGTPTTERILATGAGGCSCDTSASGVDPGALALTVLLLGAALLGRRRRRSGRRQRRPRRSSRDGGQR